MSLHDKDCNIVFDGTDLFVMFDNVKIAKRGHPDTPDAMTWVSLEPRYTVSSEGNQLIIDFDGNEVKKQQMIVPVDAQTNLERLQRILSN